MRFKFWPSLFVVASAIAAAIPATSQVVPAYTSSKSLPISIGAGGSSFDPDWGHGRMWGTTAWVDWYPGFLRNHVRGLGFEVLGRDISIGQNLPAQKNIRQDTLEGGGIYSLRTFRNFHPYAKMLLGYGSYDFTSPSPTYHHDTRSLMAGGGGIDYRIVGPLWVRADYEYQVWQKLLGNYPDPQGFNLGLSYDFNHGRGH